MKASIRLLAAALAASGFGIGGDTARAEGPDPRLREVWYDSRAVVEVPVQRGVVTLIELDPDEAITDVGAGLGADCSKPEAAWCIATQPGGRSLFVKPKSGATAPNNVAVVTDKRTHSLRFSVLPDGTSRLPVYRLTIKAPITRTATASRRLVPAPAPSQPVAMAPASQDDVAGRLQAAPQVVNTAYALAEGKDSADIVPALVFDDGRFTYLRFAGNGDLPAVFHVLGDGAETLVNTRMEGDLLVIDRVSRQLMLRAGTAVIGIWNEAFDIEGAPPQLGTTVSGVERIVRSGRSRTREGTLHE